MARHKFTEEERREIAFEIAYIHNQNRKNNLQSGNDLYIEQTRDQYGHFGGKK